MPEMLPVASSLFDAIAHDAERNELHIRFKNGTRYVVSGVTAEDHQRLMNADSLGGHWNKEIKGKFPTRIVDETVRESER